MILVLHMACFIDVFAERTRNKSMEKNSRIELSTIHMTTKGSTEECNWRCGTN